jgi:hypothetical protein
MFILTNNSFLIANFNRQLNKKFISFGEQLEMRSSLSNFNKWSLILNWHIFVLAKFFCKYICIMDQCPFYILL